MEKSSSFRWVWMTPGGSFPLARPVSILLWIPLSEIRWPSCAGSGLSKSDQILQEGERQERVLLK